MPALMQHATGSWWITRSNQQHAIPARLSRITAIFARIVRRLPGIEHDVAIRYSGCGWGDDTERHLLDDVFSGQRRGRLG